MARSGIYAIRCILNDKVYIGSTVDLVKRWSRHRVSLSEGIHHSPALQGAWNKYGADQFAFEVLEVVTDRSQLVPAEQRWIDRFRSYERTHGYNICPTAGSHQGRKLSPEHKAKIGTASKGRIHSPEAKLKISEANKGAIRSPEMRAKISGKLKDRPLSQETRNKMSVARKGKPCRKRGKQSPEVIAKRVAGMIGRKLNPEQCAAISVRMKGTRPSPKTMAKMSASQLARHAKRREERTEKRQKLFNFPD